MTIDVLGAARNDIAEMSAMLGRAYEDDPVGRWLLPDPSRRAKRLPKFFSALARHHHFAVGGVQVARREGTIGAAALWDPRGRWSHTPLEQLRPCRP